MHLRLRVLPPEGTTISPDLVHRLRQILTHIEVAFTIDEEALHQTPTIEVIDTTEDEGRFIIRMLQRAGYNIEITT